MGIVTVMGEEDMEEGAVEMEEGVVDVKGDGGGYEEAVCWCCKIWWLWREIDNQDGVGISFL